MGSPRHDYSILALLCLASLAVFGQTITHDFINYDDHLYVTQNEVVQQGLTGRGIVWAFTAFHASNWHPLTWLSHMADCQLFGIEPGAHHAMNVLIHTLNGCLLFLLLRTLTGAAGPSAVAACLFLIHPLHVESVAWIAERKDLLCAFFVLCTLSAYARFAGTRNPIWYGASIVFFAAGLMAKPMAVTLPFLLLLLDYWPLNRFATEQARPRRSILVEKIPYFVLTILSSLITIVAQRGGASIATFHQISLLLRVENAWAAYGAYVLKTFIPTGLALPYVHAVGGISPASVAAAFVVLCGLTVLLVWKRRRAPYALVGWLWFLGTLIPVIGLIQVGDQPMADRYTYIPLIGLFIALAWGGRDLASAYPVRRPLILAAGTCALAACMVLSFFQVRHWKDSETLFRHALAVTENNATAHFNLATAYSQQGEFDQAITHFKEALVLDSDNELAHANLGIAYTQIGRFADSEAHLREAIRLDPSNARSRNKLGHSLVTQEKFDDAVAAFEKALALDPTFLVARKNLGSALMSKGALAEAVRQYEAVLDVAPGDHAVFSRLGAVMSRLGRPDKAVENLGRAVELDPKNEIYRLDLAIVLYRAGRPDEALAQCVEALRINPEYTKARAFRRSLDGAAP